MDDSGNFLIGGVTKAGNVHDSNCLAEALDSLTDLADTLELDLKESCLTLDPGFDSVGAEDEVQMHGLTPIIKPNPRPGAKELPISLARSPIGALDTAAALNPVTRLVPLPEINFSLIIKLAPKY